MIVPVSSRNGFQYLGNTRSKEVHDLYQEDTRPSGCQINEILGAGHAVRFVPDLLSTAHSEGYDNCAKCLGGSTR